MGLRPLFFGGMALMMGYFGASRELVARMLVAESELELPLAIGAVAGAPVTGDPALSVQPSLEAGFPQVLTWLPSSETGGLAGGGEA